MTFSRRRRTADSMKRLYDWFHRYYWIIERGLGPRLERIVAGTVTAIPGVREKTALDWACGSGLLTVPLARLFRSVEGRDLSAGMLARAARRAAAAGLDIPFREGNILEPREPERSFDYVFVSFALHLFPPEEQEGILRRLLRIAREAVVVIDHGRRWNPATAIVEWLEGSHYDRYLKTDFAAMARATGAARFEERTIEGYSLLLFHR
ncbi:MAG: class I SAM-dependent methyltransferase [Spirochaetes bacterium]|nr:class I SAM-dependent methyltransferase [Spirochaetota bacterium]